MEGGTWPKCYKNILREGGGRVQSEECAVAVDYDERVEEGVAAALEERQGQHHPEFARKALESGNECVGN